MMKKLALCTFALFLLMLIVPALALIGFSPDNSNEPKTLVQASVKQSGKAENSVYESKVLTVSGSTFTEFKVLDVSENSVLNISARDYVIGAVCAEMPVSFEIEALKAQAVAAYTYAVRQTLNEIENPTPELLGANFSNDSEIYQAFYTNEQIRAVFGENYDEYYGKISQAVDAVFGQLLIYEGEPIIAAFHAISSGTTESAENVWGGSEEYLVAVESASDMQTKGYASEYDYSVEQMREILEENVENADLSLDPSLWLQVLSVSDSKTVLQISVGGVILSGTQLRSILGLRSAAFEVAYSAENGFAITCVGFGHGVGMSQYGANAMALSGSSYNEILAHYYPGTKIAEIEIVF